MKLRTAVIAALTVCAVAAWAGTGMETNHEGSAELQRLKKLAGNWTFTHDMGQGPRPYTVNYKVSSAGSTVVETMNVGDPMEMVSVYHDNHGSLAMSHYCALGNHPYLALVGSDEQSITLSLKGDRGLTDPNEAHMHALKITFLDENTVQEDWTHYQDGHEDGVHSFTLTRVK